MILETESILAIFLAFLSTTALLSTAARNGEAAQRNLAWSEKQLEADELADLISVKMIDGSGNVLITAVGEMGLNRTQVQLGGRSFGPVPPSDESVFASKRLVLLSGVPSLLEVKKW